MDTLPTISLVTATLNAADYLEPSLESIRGQGYQRLEHIIVEGGSSDATPEILEKYRTCLKILPQEGVGPAPALNQGFRAGGGEIMGWLGGDDLLFPWTLLTVGSIFAAHPEVMWITSLRPAIIDSFGIVTVNALSGVSRQAFLDGRFLVREAAGLTEIAGRANNLRPIQQESTFWRKSLWEAAGPLDEELLAFDFDLWARFMELSEPWGVCVPLGAFRVRQGQLSSSISRYAREMVGVLERARQGARWSPPAPDPVYSGRKIVRRGVAEERLEWAGLTYPFKDEFEV